MVRGSYFLPEAFAPVKRVARCWLSGGCLLEARWAEWRDCNQPAAHDATTLGWRPRWDRHL